MQKNLPKGWCKEVLKELVVAKKGKKPKTLYEYEFKGSTPYIDIRAVEKGEIRQFADIASSQIVSSDELVVVWDGARCGWVGRDVAGALGSTLMSLCPNCINKDYLYYFLQSKFIEINTNPRGTGIPHVDPNLFWSLGIPLAPLLEQNRIVKKLDSLMAQVEACKEQLEKVPALLKAFRQSVLNAAVTGKLTEEWRRVRGLNFDWKKCTLEEVLDGKPKNGYSAKPVNYETPFKVLTLSATTSGKFNPNCFKYFDEKIPKDSIFWIQPGDILIQRGNTLEYVGVSAIYEGLPSQFIFPDLMIMIRANQKNHYKFLYYCLSSTKARNYLRSKATGTAGNMPKINQPTLLSLSINLPTLNEQEEIVKQVSQLFELADTIEQQYKEAKAQVDALPQAILAKAFRGELVPQDPNDEPAEMLLERIKKEKEKAEGEKKGKRRKEVVG